MYIQLSGVPPFNGKNDTEILEKVSNGKYSLSGAEFQSISSEAKDLISKMLEYNAESRLSALEAINHDWFTKVMGTQEGEINIDNLKNLKAFNSKSKLQAAIYFFIVNNMATKEEKNSLIKTFKALDLKGDGKLTSDELMAGYNSKGLDFSPEEIDILINKQDINQSGFIDYTEFVAAAIDREKLLTKQRIEACFELFDKDNSGKITKDELKVMLGVNQKVDDTIWNDLIKEVDLNGYGEIELSEFKDMLLKLT